METKTSSNGLKYQVLNKEEVIELNEGVPYMQYVKDKMEWDENKKYILVLSTGSFVLVGGTEQSDDEILSDFINYSI
jgi:hypothetical protein